MKLTKQRLAEATQKELEEAIRRSPGDWMDDIVGSIDEPQVELLRILVAMHGPSGPTTRDIAWEIIEKFAVAAGQQAYDTIISHPGNI